MKKLIFTIVAIALILLGLYITYTSQITTIGLVNFRDAQMAEIAKSNDNRFIKPVQIDPETSDFSELVDMPVIYLFHISILSPEQKENIKKAMDGGSKVHVLMATSKENDFSNITGEDLKYIKDCFDNNGVENTKRWLNYSRKVLHQKSWFTTEVTPAKIFPKDVCYRIGTNDYFEEVSEYWNYYKENGWYKNNRPTIVLMSANNGPQSQFRSYLDEMILELERREFNVVCLAGRKKKLENLKALNPQMVIAFPHGRLAKGDASVDWLKKNNILYLTPQLVYQKEKEWLEDQQGISGGIMGQNIVVPELDGAIQPFAIAAQYVTQEGYHTFKPIPGRIERFCETATRWLSLRNKANAEKKLVIYYYKGAGKNALVAGGLEVGQSIYSLLQKLKATGYDLGNLADYESFIARIQKEGPLLGDYAKGTFETFLEEGKPAMVPTQEYVSWCKSELDPKSYEEVVATYGPAPGDYLSTTKDNSSYLAIPRVQFGNVVLMPVLPAAFGESEFKLVHGVKKAPPHAYIASYLWARKGFKADVVAHFGAHGSVEFTPWKQLVLSLQDWPESLITPVPHLYIYSIDNIGEAMMAKRRTYATMISHLTPPYSDAELYGELQEIAEVLHKYDGIQEGALKQTYRRKILSVIDSLHLEKDMGLTKEEIADLNNETVARIHHYLHEVEEEKITMGLHTFGVNQTKEEQVETVRMMAIDPIASALKELDTYKNKKRKHWHHHHHQVRRLEDIDPTDFTAQASFMIQQILAGKTTPQAMFGKENTNLLKQMQNEYGALEKTAISEYYGGSYARKKTAAQDKKSTAKKAMVYDSKTHKMVPKSSGQSEQLDVEQAKKIMVHLAASRKTAKALAYLQTEAGFKELSGLLDKKSLKQFKTAASFNKKVTWKVAVFENQSFVKFLQFVQDSVSRAQVFASLENKETKDKITSYRNKLDAYILKKASEKSRMNSLLTAYRTETEKWRKQLQKYNRVEAKELHSQLKYYGNNKEAIVANAGDEGDIAVIKQLLSSNAATETLETKLQLVKNRIEKETQREKNIFAALLQLKSSLWDIHHYKEGIGISPTLELDAFVKGMDGGYIAPSSGGDPVSNPLSVPTGKNLYAINEQVTPTKEAYETGQLLAEQILQKHIAKHGEFPKKIAYSLWGGEFIRNQGMNIGQIFYMLGVEPVRNHYGRVHDVKLIPIEKLTRPRIDVLVQTSGQFRDLAASRIDLINKAVKLAAEAEDDQAYKNYVKEGVLLAEAQLKEKGFTPEEAQRFSTARVFGGLNGNYGTAIMGLVEQGDKWETEQDIAATYINNMGAIYGSDNWAFYKKGMFETMMSNTEIVVHPRSSNDTGPISLDHVYEFMGGLTASIRVTTGKDPDGYFNDYRNRYNPKAQTLKEAIWTETRTNLFNPKFIKAQMQEGETAAENFAESFRDTYGWNVMKPAAIDKEIWEGYYDIYVKDKKNYGTLEFFKSTNPYALQEMTAVMLETIRKGYWQPTQAVTKDIANLHANLIAEHQAGCSGFVCDNSKLREMIAALLEDDMQAKYQDAIDAVKTGATKENANKEGMVLEKEVVQKEPIVQVLKDNLNTILLLVLLIGGAITWGVIKRKREQE